MQHGGSHLSVLFHLIVCHGNSQLDSDLCSRDLRDGAHIAQGVECFLEGPTRRFV